MTKKLGRILKQMTDSCDSQQAAVSECLYLIAGNGDGQETDSFLIGCAGEIRDAAQSVIDQMTPKKKAKKGATVETDAHAALVELASMLMGRWGEAVDNDDEISGCDAVDSIGCYVKLAQDALAMERTNAKQATQQAEFIAMLSRMKTDEEYGEDGTPHIIGLAIALGSLSAS